MTSPHAALGKIGIVLPGGFLRGAFQVGALKAFHEHRIIPSYVVGVSVGAINGVAFVAGQMDTLWNVYQEIAKRPRKFVYGFNFFTVLRAFFWSKSILVNTPLRKQIIESGINLQAVLTSSIRIDIIATDFQTGEAVVFSNKIPEHQNAVTLESALLATSAMPIVFPSETYKAHQMFDGSIIEKAPITFAVKEGCDTIFVILNDSPDSIVTHRRFDTIYSIAKRVNKIIGWHAVRRDMDRGVEINSDIEAYDDLKNDLRSLVSRRGGSDLADEMEKILNVSRFSFQKKRRVRIYVIAPAEGFLESAESVFIHQQIPRFLKEGQRRALEKFRELHLIEHS